MRPAGLVICSDFIEIRNGILHHQKMRNILVSASIQEKPYFFCARHLRDNSIIRIKTIGLNGNDFKSDCRDINVKTFNTLISDNCNCRQVAEHHVSLMVNEKIGTL